VASTREHPWHDLGVELTAAGGRKEGTLGHCLHRQQAGSVESDRNFLCDKMFIAKLQSWTYKFKQSEKSTIIMC